MNIKWSNLFLLTAVASGVAPVALADDPTATVVEGKPLTVTISATAEATGDASSQPPRVVVVTDDTVDATGAPAEAKAITIRLVGDGQGFVAESKDAPGAEGKKVPFIGVVTSPLGEAVRAQTTLPEDVGLSVDVVSPDSPAAKAGLKAHDILAKYDDQLLCAAVQLSALVKRTGTGNKATLTVLRGGKEMPIEVTVGEHAAQATFKVEGVNIAMGQPGGPRVVAGQPLAPEVIKLIEEMGSKAGGAVFGGQYGFAVPAPGVDAPILLQQSPAPNASPLQPQPNQLQSNQIQRNQRIVLVNPNVQSQSQSVSIVANDDGRVELREVNGKRTVTILDKAGAQQYSGALDSKEDREKIPAELRSRVEQAEASAGPKAVVPPLAPPVPVAPGGDAAGGGSR
jgi:membrane-associated protease RseP (regulator of RpoE activity)